MTRLRNPLPALACMLAFAAPTALSERAAAQEQRIRSSVDDHLVDAETKAAIERGLQYLQKTQERTGSWDQLVGYKLNSDYETVDNRPLPHVGVTALACISFLAGGHLPDRGKYGETITKGLDHVLSCAQDDGNITENGARMYSHAIATLAVSEAYAMTNDAALLPTVQNGARYSGSAMNPRTGGWRYDFSSDDPGLPRVARAL